mmetsp:Transcript_10253/g.30006  ORF Transcript_10253/g.30006 Transcript_10253/m.30006 type:complete len:1187 (-) Transcript_10253:98-3658(-)
MPATATAVVPYVRAEFAPDDGADEFVEVDPDVGLTPEDKDELLALEDGPDGQKKKVIQTERLVIQGKRYIRIFLEAEGKTVEAWTECVAQLADGRGWGSEKVQEELKRMLLKWKEQGWIRKDEEGKTKDKTYPINETNLRALRSGYQAILTQPPTKFLRLGKDGYFNKLPIYQELWESCKGKVAEERIAAGTAQLTSSGTLTLTMQEIKIMLAKCIELADECDSGKRSGNPYKWLQCHTLLIASTTLGGRSHNLVDTVKGQVKAEEWGVGEDGSPMWQSPDADGVTGFSPEIIALDNVYIKGGGSATFCFMNHKLPELDLLCSLGFKLFYQHSAATHGDSVVPPTSSNWMKGNAREGGPGHFCPFFLSHLDRRSWDKPLSSASGRSADIGELADELNINVGQSGTKDCRLGVLYCFRQFGTQSGSSNTGHSEETAAAANLQSDGTKRDGHYAHKRFDVLALRGGRPSAAACKEGPTASDRVLHSQLKPETRKILGEMLGSALSQKYVKERAAALAYTDKIKVGSREYVLKKNYEANDLLLFNFIVLCLARRRGKNRLIDTAESGASLFSVSPLARKVLGGIVNHPHFKVIEAAMASAEHYEVRVLGDKANWAEKDVLTWLATMGGVHTMLTNQSAELRGDMRRIELAAEAAGSAAAAAGSAAAPYVTDEVYAAIWHGPTFATPPLDIVDAFAHAASTTEGTRFSLGLQRLRAALDACPGLDLDLDKLRSELIAAVKLAALWRRPPASDRARANLVNGMTAYALFLAKDLPSLDVAKERVAHCMETDFTDVRLDGLDSDVELLARGELAPAAAEPAPAAAPSLPINDGEVAFISTHYYAGAAPSALPPAPPLLALQPPREPVPQQLTVSDPQPSPSASPLALPGPPPARPGPDPTNIFRCDGSLSQCARGYVERALELEMEGPKEKKVPVWRKDYKKASCRTEFLNTLFCIVIEAGFDLDKVPDVLRAREGLKSLREWREGFQNKEEWRENRRRAIDIIHGERWREFRTAVLAGVEESSAAGLTASLPSAPGAVPLSIGLRPEREEEEEGEEPAVHRPAAPRPSGAASKRRSPGQASAAGPSRVSQQPDPDAVFGAPPPPQVLARRPSRAALLPPPDLSLPPPPPSSLQAPPPRITFDEKVQFIRAQMRFAEDWIDYKVIVEAERRLWIDPCGNLGARAHAAYIALL